MWVIAVVSAFILASTPIIIIGKMHEMDFQRALADFESKFPKNSSIAHAVYGNYTSLALLIATARTLAHGSVTVGIEDFLRTMNNNNVSTIWKIAVKGESPYFQYWFSNGTNGYWLQIDSRYFP